MNVFDLFAKISLDTSAYESALSGAKSSASGFGSTLTNVVGHAVDFVKTSLETAGRATAAFIGDSIQTGREFDQAMSQVAATMGTSVGEIENLRDFAREMGASTAFSATEAAEALNYMALAGYDAETSMSMLPNVLNLAAAGNIDLARASDMVTDTQTAFGLSLERTTQMVDEMAKAASTGNTNVEQLGDAFLTVGGLAQELNGGFVTLEDGTQAEVDGVQELEIALTAMANAGIKGSEAGTHMRNMLLKLTSPTAEGAEAFEKLGVKAFDANGKMKSLNTIFGDLNTSLGRLTQEEKLQRISELFNTRDTASAEALLNAIGEDWDHIGESILDAKGAAEEMAETQLDNLEGDITKFKSALDEAKISISDRLSPTLRDLVQTGTRELGHLAEAFQGNGFRGLFTVIRLDIEQAQRHIENFIDDIDFEGMARTAGQKAPQVITSMIQAWTNPEWKQPFLDAGSAIVNGLIDGLFSDEALDRIFDTENGAPKIISNIAEGITNFLTGEDGDGGLIGAATDIITKLVDYFTDPDNKENIKAGAQDILVVLGESFCKVVSCIHQNIVKLMSSIMLDMAGSADYDATAADILGRLGQALLRQAATSYKTLFAGPLVTAGDYFFDDPNYIAALEAWNNAPDYHGSIEDWLNGGWEEYMARKAMSQSYRDSYDMIRGGAGGSAAASAFYNATGISFDDRHAAGFYANRPAHLTNSLVGEAGDEVLLPLDSNTAWMDKLAEKLGERMGGGSVVIQFGDINVNGTENVGREVVEQIDTALRQYQIMQQRGVAGWAR